MPDHIDVEKLVQTTDPKKDIDGFHPDSPFILPLPLAVGKILEEVYIQSQEGQKTNNIIAKSINNSDFVTWLKNKKIVLIGKGPTGGGPIITYLKKLDITPNIIDSKTTSPDKLLKGADIVISAVGTKNTIHKDNLKKGVTLISVGINRDENKKLHGDYDEETIKNIASFYTPTPGGVGPVNVAMLMVNLLTAAENQTSK